MPSRASAYRGARRSAGAAAARGLAAASRAPSKAHIIGCNKSVWGLVHLLVMCGGAWGTTTIPTPRSRSQETLTFQASYLSAAPATGTMTTLTISISDVFRRSHAMENERGASGERLLQISCTCASSPISPGVASEGTTFDGIRLAGLLRDEQQGLPDRTLVVQYSRMNQPVPRKWDAAILCDNESFRANVAIRSPVAHFGRVLVTGPGRAARLDHGHHVDRHPQRAAG